jgi:hypothetical protein
MLGALYAARIAKIVLCVVPIVIGVLLAALGAFLLYNSKKIRRQETLGIIDKAEYITLKGINESNERTKVNPED